MPRLAVRMVSQFDNCVRMYFPTIELDAGDLECFWGGLFGSESILEILVIIILVIIADCDASILILVFDAF